MEHLEPNFIRYLRYALQSSRIIQLPFYLLMAHIPLSHSMENEVDNFKLGIVCRPGQVCSLQGPIVEMMALWQLNNQERAQAGHRASRPDDVHTVVGERIRPVSRNIKFSSPCNTPFSFTFHVNLRMLRIEVWTSRWLPLILHDTHNFHTYFPQVATIGKVFPPPLAVITHNWNRMHRQSY